MSAHTATLFHQHSLSIADLALPVSTFPYTRLTQHYCSALGVGSENLLSSAFPPQASLFVKQLHQPIAIPQV